MVSKQAHQKKHHDSHAKLQRFLPSQLIKGRDFHSSSKWIPGVIVCCTVHVSYTVKLEDGKIIHRHTDHLRDQSTSSTSTPTPDSAVQDFELFLDPHADELSDQSPEPSPDNPMHRYPKQKCQPPDHFMNSHVQQGRKCSICTQPNNY